MKIRLGNVLDAMDLLYALPNTCLMICSITEDIYGQIYFRRYCNIIYCGETQDENALFENIIPNMDSSEPGSII